MNCVKPKNRFSAIFSKISILWYVLLHKLYINMGISHILMYRNSLYDLPWPQCKNSSDSETLKNKNGRDKERVWRRGTKLATSLIMFVRLRVLTG